MDTEKHDEGALMSTFLAETFYIFWSAAKYCHLQFIPELTFRYEVRGFGINRKMTKKSRAVEIIISKQIFLV